MAEEYASVEALRAELAEIVIPRFGYDEAWRLGNVLWQTAVDAGLAVAIRVQLGEQIAFHAARPGTSEVNESWLARKHRAVLRWGASSLELRMRSEADDPELAGADEVLFAFAGGCVPIVVAGETVATVAVSGLADIDDHVVAVAALRQLASELA